MSDWPGKFDPSAIQTVMASRSQALADLDALEVVGHRLVAHGGVGVGQGAELVGQRLARLVLEGVGIDRVEGRVRGAAACSLSSP